jgi:hypothetical protein
MFTFIGRKIVKSKEDFSESERDQWLAYLKYDDDQYITPTDVNYKDGMGYIDEVWIDSFSWQSDKELIVKDMYSYLENFQYGAVFLDDESSIVWINDQGCLKWDKEDEKVALLRKEKNNFYNVRFHYPDDNPFEIVKKRKEIFDEYTAQQELRANLPRFPEINTKPFGKFFGLPTISKEDERNKTIECLSKLSPEIKFFYNSDDILSVELPPISKSKIKYPEPVTTMKSNLPITPELESFKLILEEISTSLLSNLRSSDNKPVIYGTKKEYIEIPEKHLNSSLFKEIPISYPFFNTSLIYPPKMEYTDEQLAEFQMREEEQWERERTFLHEFDLKSTKFATKMSDLTEEEISSWRSYLKRERFIHDGIVDLFDNTEYWDGYSKEIQVMYFEWTHDDKVELLLDMCGWWRAEVGAVFLDNVMVFDNSDRYIYELETTPKELKDRVDSYRHIRIQDCIDECDNNNPAHERCKTIREKYKVVSNDYYF